MTENKAIKATDLSMSQIIRRENNSWPYFRHYWQNLKLVMTDQPSGFKWYMFFPNSLRCEFSTKLGCFKKHGL